MTYQEACSILPREDRMTAEIHALVSLLKKKGLCSTAEFEGQVVNWTKAAYGPETVNRMGLLTMKVAKHFNVTAVDIRSKTQVRQIVFPRQVLMYLARATTDLSMRQVGIYVGLKHHTTVLYAVETIAARRQVDRKLDNFIRQVSDECAESMGWE